MSATTGTDPLKWYTRGLRIPRFIGKLPTGEQIKGGPYPVSQVVAFAVVVVLGAYSMPLWGPYAAQGAFAFVGNALIILGCAGVVSFIVRLLPQTAVSPAAMAAGGARSVSGSGRMTHRGRPLHLGRPQQVRGRATVTDIDVHEWALAARNVSRVVSPPDETTAVTPKPAPAPVPVPQARPRSASVEHKLAALVAARKG